MEHLDGHVATARGTKAHLLPVATVGEHAAVVVEGKRTHRRGGAHLITVGGVGNQHLGLKDIAVRAAVLARQERDVGEIVVAAQVDGQVLGHTGLIGPVAVPERLLIAVKSVDGVAALIVGLAREAGHLDVLAVLGRVDEALLIDGAHLEAVDCLLDLGRGVCDILLAIAALAAIEELLSRLDRSGEGCIGILGVDGLAVARGLGKRCHERRGVDTSLDLDLIGCGLGGIEHRRHRDRCLAGLVGAQVVAHAIAGLDSGDAHHRRIGALDRHIGVAGALGRGLGVDERHIALEELGLVLAQFDTLDGLDTLCVVEVDLAQREHLVTRCLKRRDLDLGRLLALVLGREAKGVASLIGIKASARELLGRAVLERHDGLNLLHGAVATVAVNDLDAIEFRRRLEGERHRGGQLDVGRHLAVDPVGPIVPQELEVVAALIVVEQSVIALLLDELLDVGAVVGGELVVGHRDVKGVAAVLGLGGLRDTGHRHGAITHELERVARRADEPRRRGQLDLAGRLSLEFKARDHTSTVEELGVAAVGEGQVDGLVAIRELHFLAREVLHARRRRILRDALGDILELVAVEVDERTERVDVLGVGGVDVDRDLVAGLDLHLARDHREGASSLALLLGAAVERRHGEGVVVHVVDAVAVEVGEVGADLGVERRGVGLAVLKTQVILHVGVVAVGDRGLVEVGAHSEAVRAVGLVDGDLGGGEEVAHGRERRHTHVARGHGAVERHRLASGGALPVDLLRRPMHAVEARLDAHLGHSAVTGIIARIVLELVELVSATVVNGKRLAQIVATGVETAVARLELMVEGEFGLMATVERALPSDFLGLRHVPPRVERRVRLKHVAPCGVAIGVARTNLVGMLAVVGKIGMREFCRIAHGEHSAVYLKVVGGSTIDLPPGELNARGGRGVLGGSKVRGCGEVLVEAVGRERGIGVHEIAQFERLRCRGDIGLRELDVDLGIRGDLGVVEALALLGLGAACVATVVVEVGGLVVEVDRLAGLGGRGVKGLLRVDLNHVERGSAVLGGDARGLGGDVGHKGRGAVGVVAAVAALRCLGGKGRRAAHHTRLIDGAHMLTVGNIVDCAVGIVLGRVVLDGGAVILVLRKAALTLGGEELDDTLAAIGALGVGLGHSLGVVVLGVHRHDGVGLNKEWQLPKRSLVVVEDLTAAVLLAREVVNPDGGILVGTVVGQVDTVADIVAVLICLGILIHRCHQEVLTEHVLVLRRGACGVLGVVGKQHGADHGKAGIAVARVDVGRRGRARVDIGHELCFELEIEARDARVWIAVRHGRLAVGAPTVHVKHRGRECLPLVVASGDDGIATKDAVHIGADVGVAREALADIRGDMEANVLPVTAVLVAGPDAAKALRAGPAVKRDDVGALVGAGGHGVIGRLDAVEAKGVAGADPSDVGLERGDATSLNLRIEIAQQMPRGLGVAIGLKVRLGPETGAHALGVGILGELLKIVDVGAHGVEALGRTRSVGVDAAGLVVTVLAVASTVTVVRQEPAERHVVVLVVIDNLPGGELAVEIGRLHVLGINRRALTVERLGRKRAVELVARRHAGLVFNVALLTRGLAALGLPLLLTRGR